MRLFGPSGAKQIIGIVGTLIAAATSILIVACGPENNGTERVGFMPQTFDRKRAQEVGPERCVACHQDQVTDWKTSHHAIANRPIDPETDVPHFRLAGFDAENLKIIDQRGEYPVAGVIGVEPLYQYLVPSDDGRLQAHSLAFDPIHEEWFDVFGGEERLPGEWGHWTGQGMNWNSNCAWCHTTEFKKNYDRETDTYQSTWTVQGISCVQCHTNSAAHADAAESGGYAMANGSEIDPELAMENCASCHARREELTTGEFRSGDRFHDHFRLTLPDTPGAYFPDGQAREEDFVYASFRLSAMGHAGISCLDCHNPHSGEVVLPAVNNALCMSCHDTGQRQAPIIDPVAHSHHSAGSTGSRCIECHMPKRTYMARDPRRDHGFTSPDPWMTIQMGVPNACTQCHQDQADQWALEHVESWFGSEKREAKRHRAQWVSALAEGRLHGEVEDLVQLIQSESNSYWRTTLLREAAALGIGPVATALSTDYVGAATPLERGAALTLYAQSDEFVPDSLRKYLDDESRLVRVTASELLFRFQGSPDRLPVDFVRHLDANADRPMGAFGLAEVALISGDLATAMSELRRAISFDRVNPALYFEAASLLDRHGQAERALNILSSAPVAARASGQLAYAEGLLHAAGGNYRAAVNRMENAVSKDPHQPRWWYNLSLSYLKMGATEQAMAKLEAGLGQNPEDPTLLSLRDYYLQSQGAPGR